ncbi:MAG: acyl-CoA thioesterase [Bacteroidales bacterium]|nr:acyl-CoA thioesterase [Bacteroidales bacterium]
MFSYTITPRVADTDALGHINNTVLPCWFEEARTPLFKILNPTMDFNNWNLILARMEVDYLKQIFFHSQVEVKSWISRMGNSSFDITQELWQDGNLCARSKSVIVHFDFKTQKSVPIVGTMRSDLEAHLQ